MGKRELGSLCFFLTAALWKLTILFSLTLVAADAHDESPQQVERRRDVLLLPLRRHPAAAKTTTERARKRTATNSNFCRALAMQVLQRGEETSCCFFLTEKCVIVTHFPQRRDFALRTSRNPLSKMTFLVDKKVHSPQNENAKCNVKIFQRKQFHFPHSSTFPLSTAFARDPKLV